MILFSLIIYLVLTLIVFIENSETDNRSVIAAVLNTAHLCIQIALAIIQKYRIYCSERLHISTLYQHVSYIQQHPKVTLDTNFNCALLLMLLNYLQDGLTSCIRVCFFFFFLFGLEFYTI